MATTTPNYGWTVPTSSDLVKNGATAIETLGDSVDTTTKALNPSTTLGDIEYRSATANTNTRLGIGTTGQVLTVTGGVPAWATASAGSASWTLLNASGTALTGATTITVSGISGQSQLMIIVRGASSANALSVMTLRLNADTGTNYIQVGGKQTGSSDVAYQDLSQTSFSLGKQDNNANGKLVAGLWLSGTNSTGIKVGHQYGLGENFGSGQNEGFMTFNTYSGSSTISSVSIISSTGNFDAGTIYVYGSAV